MISSVLKGQIEKIIDLQIEENFDLTSFSTIKIKSIAKIFIKVESENSLIELIKIFNKNKISFLVIGRGSNLILPPVINKPVIKLAFRFDVKLLQNVKDSYFIPANVPLNILTGKAIKLGLKGWEVFTGIPANLGGAIFMNAGTSLGEIGSLIKSVKILKKNGKVINYKIKENDFTYRKNHFLESTDIILAAEVKHFGVDKDIPNKIINYLRKRSQNQPLTQNTCGCTFKNIAIFPDGRTNSCVAGQIIDIIGLKGFKYKNLRVSKVHGNFIENIGESTQEDFLELVEIINSRIEREYGHKLEMEAIVISDSVD